MSGRGDVLAEFLERNGWGRARRRPLAGDASFRRYERLEMDGRHAVLMDAPPPHEDVRPFLFIARHLIGCGYSAPRILAADEAAGALLLEDLGDDLYSRVIAAGGDETALYAAAVDLLADLHRRPPPEGLARYDKAALVATANLLVEWYLPAVTGRDTDEATKAGYADALGESLANLPELPEVLVLRDYHADNLLWLPGRDGPARVGLLDFQDAVIGSPAYDLVSLLEDARRDVAPGLAAAMVRRYVGASGIDGDALGTAYAILGAQRNARIIGIFARLWRRDGKARYLPLIPRVWRLLEGDLRHPALAALREWFDTSVPPALRRIDLRGEES